MWENIINPWNNTNLFRQIVGLIASDTVAELFLLYFLNDFTAFNDNKNQPVFCKPKRIQQALHVTDVIFYHIRNILQGNQAFLFIVRGQLS